MESQRSGLRALLQAGTFPALSSILTPSLSVELAPTKLLPPGGLEDQGPGARSLEAFCSAPLFPLAQLTVTRSPLGWTFIILGVQPAFTHTLPGPHFEPCIAAPALTLPSVTSGSVCSCTPLAPYLQSRPVLVQTGSAYDHPWPPCPPCVGPTTAVLAPWRPH